MSRPFVLLVFALLVVPVAIAGCFGEVAAVYVPASDVPSGWDHVTQNESQEAANGVVDIRTNRYAHQGALVGEVYLIGVTDVPGVDEHDQIREQIDAYADQQGVQMEKTGETRVRLDNGKTVDATEYDITKNVGGTELDGKAWFLRWDTGDFSAGGIGWATTERPTLFGLEADESVWHAAQAMMRAAEW